MGAENPKGDPMSPVVVVGLGALDAALVSQAVYAYRDLTRADRKRTPATEKQRPS
jgi:hypothetical protein